MQECVEAAAAEARAHGGFDETAEMWRNSMAGLALTLLLYLGGEPDVVRIVHPGARPIKESIRRRDPERWKDLDEPSPYTVGREFARAIERWEVEHGARFLIAARALLKGLPGTKTRASPEYGRTPGQHRRTMDDS